MTEQQADYDTDDTQPTPGAWVRRYSEELDPLVHAESGEFLVVCKATDVPLKEAVANARLIAVAGTAASALQEDLKIIDLFRELPKIIRAADRAVDSTRFRDEDGRAHPPDRSHMVDLRNALNAVRKDTTQTDE
jgi:hypothetical protein